jgi:uncharacterized membrane protein YjjP (DUF1212 family)
MKDIKLKNLGYLCYINFILNDMESLQKHLGEAHTILNALLKREEYLETVIIWLNLFGFLLTAYFNEEDLFNFIEVFDLIVDKYKDELNIDVFFKNFVFAKLFFFSGQHRKAQKTFLETLEMHQYFIVDGLKVR